MFAVFDDNCEITSEGSLKIKLPAETKATIREHFPNADSVAVISNPEQFIEDVEKSIGHRMEHECVHYFHIDKGLKIENSDQTAMDMEYMKYLMQDTPPKVEKGKTTYSFAANMPTECCFVKMFSSNASKNIDSFCLKKQFIKAPSIQLKFKKASLFTLLMNF